MGLQVEGLSKRFGGVPAVEDVSFAVAAGELLCLLGPSGCGKTTTLRCVAGLERPDAGTVRLGGVTLTDAGAGIAVPANRRNIGMVFQSYAVWPHMTVAENVRYPLRFGRKLSAAEAAARCGEALRQVRLEGFEGRLPHQLSGGQQQRVALARALVMEPRLLLFDEPLSNLDARLREEMRIELSDLRGRLGIPVLYVTHDQAEAMALATRIVVMEEGRILQIGAPEEVYRHPAGEAVARFIGAANLVPGQVTDVSAHPRVAVRTELGQLRPVARQPVAVGDAVLVVIRPEQVAVHSDRPAEGDVVEAGLVHLLFAGAATECVVEAGSLRLRAQARQTVRLRRGMKVFLALDDAGCVLVARGQGPARPPSGRAGGS